jgi:UPF0271 protein
MNSTVDLNADVGESTGSRHYGDDEGVMPHITSANIACGFHAGDPGVMRATVALARAHGVAVGAHPSLDDREGFGRREMAVSPEQIENLVAYQIGALAGIAAGQGVALAHVKPHGALYNMAARQRRLADAVVRAIRAVDPALVLFGLANSELLRAASQAGLPAASEGFADRGYKATGELAPRDVPGGVIDEVDAVLARATGMVLAQSVQSVDGVRVRLTVDTLCVHGDTPGAAELARRLRDTLSRAGVSVLCVRADRLRPTRG